MSKEKQTTRNQHYVPKLILKRFCYKPKYCYVLTPNGIIDEKNIKNICFERDMYEFSNKINAKPNIIEDDFGEDETEMGNILNKIDKLESADSVLAMLDEHKDFIPYFSWQLIIRNKLIIPNITDVNKALGRVKNDHICDRDLNLFSLIDAKNKYKEIKKSSTTLVIDDSINKRFITSNLPFAILSMFPGITVFAIILTPYILNILILYHGYNGPETRQSLICNDESFVDYINNQIYSQNFEYLIAKSKEELNLYKNRIGKLSP